MQLLLRPTKGLDALEKIQQRLGGSRFQSLDERSRILRFATAHGAHEAAQLVLRRAIALEWLALEHAELREVAQALDYLLDPVDSQRPDELALEIRVAHEIGVDGTLEIPSLADVAQAHTYVKPKPRNSVRKLPMFVTPPSATTVTRSAARSRPCLAASASTAALSLVPSTSTAVRVPAGTSIAQVSSVS